MALNWLPLPNFSTKFLPCLKKSSSANIFRNFRKNYITFLSSALSAVFRKLVKFFLIFYHLCIAKWSIISQKSVLHINGLPVFFFFFLLDLDTAIIFQKLWLHLIHILHWSSFHPFGLFIFHWWVCIICLSSSVFCESRK